MAKQSLSEWCIKHNKETVWIGLIAIFFGVVIGCVTELFHHDIFPIWRLLLTVLWHALIIFGEALAVVFFLHYFVEKQTHEHNERVLTDRFDGLINTFENNSNEKIKQIQHNLFKAILQGANIMPVEIIDCLKKANYNTKLFRHNLDINYSFDRIDGDKFIIKQEISFHLKNNDENHENIEKFKMMLRLSSSPFVSYELMEASFYLVNHDKTHDRVRLTRGNFNNIEDVVDKVKDIGLKEDLDIIGAIASARSVGEYFKNSFCQKAAVCSFCT
jgi:hypothetical protein